MIIVYSHTYKMTKLEAPLRSLLPLDLFCTWIDWEGESSLHGHKGKEGQSQAKNSGPSFGLLCFPMHHANHIFLLNFRIQYLPNRDADIFLISWSQPFTSHLNKRMFMFWGYLCIYKTKSKMLQISNPETSLAQEKLSLYCHPWITLNEYMLLFI